MTFEQLLAGLPTQDQQGWEHLAQAEWRGATVDDYAIASPDGRSVPPLLSTDQTEDYQPVGFRQRAGWAGVSDLRGVELSLAIVTRELEGGAQGFALLQKQLGQLENSGTSVRYDYLTIVVFEADAGLETALAKVVPEAQRSAAQIFVNIDSGIRSSEGGAISESLSRKFPLARLFSEERSSPGGHARAVTIPSDYVAAVTAVASLHRGATAGSTDDTNQWVNSRSQPSAVIGVIARNGVTDRPETYLIDATVRAVAAVSAGVDVLIISPWDDTDEYRRQVRNIHHVLALEANLGGHSDALRGARLFEATSAPEGRGPLRGSHEPNT